MYWPSSAGILGISLLGSIEFGAGGHVARLLGCASGCHPAWVNMPACTLLIDRISALWRARITGFNNLLAMLFFLSLAVGSTWIAHDLWQAHEGSDLLKIPYAPLRIASIIALLTVAALFCARFAPEYPRLTHAPQIGAVGVAVLLVLLTLGVPIGRFIWGWWA